MASALHLAVRLVHVLGVTLLVGGAAVTWNALRLSPGDAEALVRQFEWSFWGTLGVLLATGVGNLGALGPPGPDTRWGAVLTLKLVAVLVLVVASFPRTLAVTRLRGRWSAADHTPLRRLYAATAWLLVGIVVLAEVLAHG